MSIQIIVKGGRSSLVKRQRACIDYIDKKTRSGTDHSDSKVQEAVKDFQRWTDKSGVYKDKSGHKYKGTSEWKPEA